MEQSKIYICIILLRLFSLCALQTNYVPDEYYQYSEPAFDAVYSRGIMSWEWTPDFKIRSYIPLFPLIGLYEFTRLVHTFIGLNFEAILYLLPRIVQTILTIGGDICYYWIAKNLKGDEFANLTTVLAVSNWSSMYMLCRPLNNSLEYSLSMYLLFILLIVNSRYKLLLLGFVAAVSFYCRPTFCLFLAPIFGVALFHRKLSIGSIFKIGLISLVVLEILICLDSSIYGGFTISPLNFLLVNVLENRAIYFGSQVWHWNFSNGLPVLLGIYFPFTVCGLLSRSRDRDFTWSLSVSGLVYPIALSLVTKHQEHRFLLPIIPLLFLQTTSFLSRQTTNSFKKLIKLFILSNILLAAYLMAFHQGGAERAFRFLSKEIRKRSPENSTTHLVIAAPCFSFPGYAYLHTESFPVHLHSIDCSPPPWSEMLKFDADIENVTSNLIMEINTGFNVSSFYLLTFDCYLPAILPVIESYNYTTVGTFTHAHFRYDYDDPNFKSKVHVMKITR